MSSLLIKNASAIVTCDSNDALLEDSNILITDGVITYMGKESRSADETIDAAGCIVYPGLINTHHHLYQTFSRNLPQVQNMELFDWLTTLYEIWKNLDGDIIYHSSMTGMGELLKTGCTTCFDHHYVFPGGNSGALLESQFAAARELGIRFYASRGSMDLSRKDGGLPPDSVVQTVDVQRRGRSVPAVRHPGKGAGSAPAHPSVRNHRRRELCTRKIRKTSAGLHGGYGLGWKGCLVRTRNPFQ